MGAIIHSNANTGFIYSMNVRFSETDENAILNVVDDPDWMHLQGLAKENIVDGSQLHEAFFEAKGVGQPKNCTLEMWVFWVFLDENSIEHATTATLELVHFDGTHYRRVVIPIQLRVL
jgi:hypothetical protein